MISERMKRKVERNSREFIFFTLVPLRKKNKNSCQYEKKREPKAHTLMQTQNVINNNFFFRFENTCI